MWMPRVLPELRSPPRVDRTSLLACQYSVQKETLDLVRTSAVLRMRAVLQQADVGVLTRETYDAATGASSGTDETAPVRGTDGSAPVDGTEESAPAEEVAPAEGSEEVAPAEGTEEVAPAEGTEESVPAEGTDEAAPAEEAAPVRRRLPPKKRHQQKLLRLNPLRGVNSSGGAVHGG